MAVKRHANEETSARNGGGNRAKLRCSFRKEVLSMDEKWLDVVGFEGLYEVSDQGNLRKIFSTGKYYSMSLNSCDKDGYVKTSLRKDGKRHYLRLHRIIAEAFLDNSEACQL